MNPHDGDAGNADEPNPAPTTPTEPSTDDAPDDTAGARVAPEPLDLDRIERDLDGVEAALRRLDDGSYWTDEVTGAALPDELLEADPVARRVEG